MNLKIGDIVKCVKWDEGLFLNEEYEVTFYEPTWCKENRAVVHVGDMNDVPYYADYFTLSKENKTEMNKLKIGDTVRCKNAVGSESLDAGRPYKIVDENQYGNIQVIQDFYPRNVLPHFYKPERFSLIEKVEKIMKEPAKNIDWVNKTYETRNGCRVNLFCLSNSSHYPLVGEYLNEEGDWVNEQWTLQGEVLTTCSFNDYDLVEKPTSIKVNCSSCSATVYDDGSIGFESETSPVLRSEDFQKILDVWNKI